MCFLLVVSSKWTPRCTCKTRAVDSHRSCVKADRSLSAESALRSMGLCSTALRAGIALSPASLHQLCVCPGEAQLNQYKKKRRAKKKEEKFRRATQVGSLGLTDGQVGSGVCAYVCVSVPRCLQVKCYYPYPPVDFSRLRTLLKPAVD